MTTPTDATIRDARSGATDSSDERMISPRFAQALRDNSPEPHDWLLAAEQLSDDYERRFCLRRAHETR